MEESASTSSLPWPFLLFQTWCYLLSPNLWPLPMSCILFHPDFLGTLSPQKQPILPVTWIPFFSFSCPLQQAFSLQGILCAQGSSTFPMPPFTILHLELSQQSCARVVYTLCPHFLAISFTPGFSSANVSSPLRLLCRLFFQKFIFTASQHTSQWIISGIPKLLCLCTCSHLCLKYLSPSFISLYSYTFLGCQLSAFSIHGAFA